GVAPQPIEAINAIEALSEKVGTNRTLTDLGATANDIEHLTTDALRDLIILNTPRYPNRDDVRGLYELAL
ncbi:MAG: iron-containing alcohol dehydrogenase, partial [Actinomycetota bacterium]|nr:iron-containing alcohol dehydrogenase [Actinomycetota bacterium]